MTHFEGNRTREKLYCFVVIAILTSTLCVRLKFEIGFLLGNKNLIERGSIFLLFILYLFYLRLRLSRTVGMKINASKVSPRVVYNLLLTVVQATALIISLEKRKF